MLQLLHLSSVRLKQTSNTNLFWTCLLLIDTDMKLFSTLSQLYQITKCGKLTINRVSIYWSVLRKRSFFQISLLLCVRLSAKLLCIKLSVEVLAKENPTHKCIPYSSAFVETQLASINIPVIQRYEQIWYVTIRWQASTSESRTREGIGHLRLIHISWQLKFDNLINYQV